MKRPFPLAPLTLPSEAAEHEVSRRDGRLRIALEDGFVILRVFCRRMRFYRDEWTGIPALRKNERVIIVL